jgi:hypothetical protein
LQGDKLAIGHIVDHGVPPGVQTCSIIAFAEDLSRKPSPLESIPKAKPPQIP